ncbi:hypothetical protein BGZ60DRAFT_411233 [Tricladium varicosporioides]|nr:hypothetical protein BGZ60DRAFT_411233 [Hymenoscyphus varicosporioides]
MKRSKTQDIDIFPNFPVACWCCQTRNCTIGEPRLNTAQNGSSRPSEKESGFSSFQYHGWNAAIPLFSKYGCGTSYENRSIMFEDSTPFVASEVTKHRRRSSWQETRRKLLFAALPVHRNASLGVSWCCNVCTRRNCAVHDEPKGPGICRMTDPL